MRRFAYPTSVILLLFGALGCSDDGSAGADSEPGSSTGGSSGASTSPSSGDTSDPTTTEGTSSASGLSTDETGVSGTDSAGSGSTGPGLQGVAVAVGYGARRVSSLDGVTWENFVELDANGSDDNNLLRGVGFGGGAFVAVGGASEGLSFSSVDGGATWENENRQPRAFLSDVVYYGDEFVAVGGNGLRVRSADLGATWEDDAGFEMGHFRAAATDGTVVVAVGNTYGGATGGISSTTDNGVDWSEPMRGGNVFRDIAWGGDVFVAVGELGRISNSSNGTAFNDQSVSGGDLLSVLFVDGTFYVTDAGRYWIPQDGEMWTEMVDAGARPLAAWFGGAYLSTGFGVLIESSPDLGEWTTVFDMDGSGLTGIAVGEIEPI